jgi:L-iditol 2-dehydrogenase
MATTEGFLMATDVCGLCGTDVEKLNTARVSDGSILGHEIVGTILETYGDLPTTSWGDTLNVGDRVMVAHHVPCGGCHYCQNHSPSMCRSFKQSNLVPGGFASHVFVSAAHVQHTTFKVPSHISSREASCIEPVACVHRAVRRVNQQTGARHQGRVGVIGLGFIGLIASQLFQHSGDTVIGYELQSKRLLLASEAGYIHHGVQPKTTESVEASAEGCWQETVAHLVVDSFNQEPVGLDVVCLSVVNPTTLAVALRLIRDGGTLLVLAGGKTPLPLETLYYREISIVSSYSPALEDVTAAAELVFSRRLSLTPLLTHPLPVHEANTGLEAYKRGEALKVLFEFTQT